MRTDKLCPTVHTSPRNHTLSSPTKRPGSWFCGDFDDPGDTGNSIGWKIPEEPIQLRSYSRKNVPTSSGRPIELRPSSYHQPGQFWRQSVIPMSMHAVETPRTRALRAGKKPGSPGYAYRPGKSAVGTPRTSPTKPAEETVAAEAAAKEEEPVV